MREEYRSGLDRENGPGEEFMPGEDAQSLQAETQDSGEEYFIHADEYNTDYSPELLEDEGRSREDEEEDPILPARADEGRRGGFFGRWLKLAGLPAAVLAFAAAAAVAVSALPGMPLAKTGKEHTPQTPPEPAHTHAAGPWITNLPPECEKDGHRYRLCTVCGAVLEEQKLPAVGHTPADEWVFTEDYTCTEDGSRRLVCTVCGEVLEEETVPAAGHTEPDNWAMDPEPTCVDAGRRVKRCTVCGEILTEEELPALGHTESDWIEFPPTCTIAGRRVKICTVCGEELDRQELPATGHVWGAWYSSLAATCTAAGSQTHICTVCGAAESHATAALGHTPQTAHKDPTCTEEGSDTTTCTRCGAVLSTLALPPNGHEYYWEDLPILTGDVCTTAHESVEICAVCGAVGDRERVEPTGHSWSYYRVGTGPVPAGYITAGNTYYTYCPVCGGYVSGRTSNRFTSAEGYMP